MSGHTQRRVWRVVWDGEPKMGGGYHEQSIGKEFHTRVEVDRAVEVLSSRSKPNLRVQTRTVTEWEDD
jgi:hypothetical protein